MSKTATLMAAGLLCCFLFSTAHAQVKSALPEPSAHFRFDGDANNLGRDRAWCRLRNTEFRDGALYVNGSYNLERGSFVICHTPGLDYQTFTVALRFKAEKFRRANSTIMYAGPGYRWFGVQRAKSGNLVVSFNQRAVAHEIDGSKIEPGTWNVLVCGADLRAGKLVAYLNGEKVAEVDLPEGFRLSVRGTRAEQRDKAWTFTDYSNGKVFHGLIDELIIYDRMLSPAEVGEVPLQP